MATKQSAAAARAKAAAEARKAKKPTPESPSAPVAGITPETHRLSTGESRPGQEEELDLVTVTAKRDLYWKGQHWPRGVDVEWPRDLAIAQGYLRTKDNPEIPSNPAAEGLTAEEIQVIHEREGLLQEQVMERAQAERDRELGSTLLAKRVNESV